MCSQNQQSITFKETHLAALYIMCAVVSIHGHTQGNLQPCQHLASTPVAHMHPFHLVYCLELLLVVVHGQ